MRIDDLRGKNLSDSSLRKRLRTRVVFPAPTSPVITIKPSPWDKPIFKISHRPVVALAAEEKIRVRFELKWLDSETVERTVHISVKSSY